MLVSGQEKIKKKHVESEESSVTNVKEKKVLIAYYSRKGANYVNGSIVDIPIGNTEIAAKMIQEIVGGDIFEIDTVNPYPKEYTATTEMAQRELRSGLRPEIKGTVPTMESYEVVFLGYPNWWGTMPMAVYTFLEAYDFSGKTIFPFCTHEGSGMGSSERDLARVCPNTAVEKGLSIQGSRVKDSKNNIISWLNAKKGL